MIEKRPESPPPCYDAAVMNGNCDDQMEKGVGEGCSDTVDVKPNNLGLNIAIADNTSEITTYNNVTGNPFWNFMESRKGFYVNICLFIVSVTLFTAVLCGLTPYISHYEITRENLKSMTKDYNDCYARQQELEAETGILKNKIHGLTDAISSLQQQLSNSRASYYLNSGSSLKPQQFFVFCTIFSILLSLYR